LRYQSRETAEKQQRDTEETRVREFLLQNYLITEEDELGEQESFLEKGILDSTSVLELVAYLETTFGIKVQDEELVPENLDSIARVASFVRHKRGLSTGTHG
jgi:acyl carrier protein